MQIEISINLLNATPGDEDLELIAILGNFIEQLKSDGLPGSGYSLTACLNGVDIVGDLRHSKC